MLGIPKDRLRPGFTAALVLFVPLAGVMIWQVQMLAVPDLVGPERLYLVMTSIYIRQLEDSIESQWGWAATNIAQKSVHPNS